MNTQRKIVSNGIVDAFVYGIFIFMGYMTWHSIYNVMGDKWMAWLGLLLFDGGAYAGYHMWTGASTSSQQVIAGKAILIADFIMAGGMIAGRLDILNPEQIRYLMLIATVINGAFLYYFKVSSAEVIEHMLEQEQKHEEDDNERKRVRNLHREAARQADAMVERQAIPMGTLMALRAAARLKYRLQLPMTEDEAKAFQGEVIDAESIPVPSLPSPTPMTLGFWDFWKSFFTRNLHTTQQGMQSQQVESSKSENSNQSNEDQQDQNQ
jgi:hypothetical protein